jgi:hypothetical protein
MVITPLPLRHSLAPFYALSLLVAVLAAAAALAGLLYPGAAYPTADLRRDLGALDVVSLSLALPALLLCLWLARRGSLVGLLCWPGALLQVLYLYVIYLLAMPYTWLLLLHLALAVLSFYALLGLLAAIDAQAVARALAGRVPVRLAAASLAGQGLLNFVFVLGAILYPLSLGAQTTAASLANHVIDLFITPAWVIAGVLLWRRRPFGYVAGLAVLFQGSLLILAAVILVLTPAVGVAGAVPVASPLVRIAVTLGFGLVCFIPFALFARGAAAQPSAFPRPLPAAKGKA